MLELVRIFDGSHAVQLDGKQLEVIRTRGAVATHGGIEPLSPGQRVEVERVLNALFSQADEEERLG